EKGLNPTLTLVDCAQGAQTAAMIAKPDAAYWKLVESRLRDAGVTPQQVQVVWFKEANAAPRAEFPAETKKLEADILQDLHTLLSKLPNVRIVYFSSRIYGGYVGTGLNPEPHAYESGFANKWLIARQIKGDPELNYDPAKGPVQAPWLAWGPYLWADGMKGRKDGKV